ncbi:MAG TPA: hypothetical protein VK595_11470 [Vicinamibacterales bacterium]|nr:hypothetical protein [Vicinamibacterales bacterium]
MIRKIIKIAVFLLIANGVYQIAPVAYRNLQFKEALKEMVLYSQRSTDAELVNRTIMLARQNNVPLEQEYVGVRHETGSIHVDATYAEPLKLFPGFTYKWEVTIDATALDLSAAAPTR